MKKTAFDKVSRHYDKFMHRMNFFRTDQIKDILQLKGEEIVLDIGGGTGYFANEIKDLCRKVIVLDESPKMIEEAGVYSDIELITSNIFQHSLKHQSVDAVILSDVFHHIEKQGELLDIVSDLLKPKGVLLIHDFDISYYKTKILRMFEFTLFGKLYFRTLEEVQSMVISHGFQIREIYNQDNFFILKGIKDG